jgi:hypothetical protein
VTLFGRRRAKRRREQDRDRAERRREQEHAERIEQSLKALPKHPTADDVRTVLVDFRHEYVGYARRNAGRLDRIFALYEQLARRVYRVLAILTVLLLLLAAFGDHLQSQGNDTITQVQSGRKLSLAVTCAVESATAQQGHKALLGPATPPKDEAALERLGLTPFPVRHAAQKKAADAYERGIADSIDQAIGGHKGDGLVQSNGALDCQRLQRLAKVPPARMPAHAPSSRPQRR